MASSSTHRPNDNPHFFKVVLANALKEQKLEIPKKFVRKYGQKAFLKNQTCLKVAGKEWTVRMSKSNERVWFHWQKLVEFYSVGLGYFLVFKYESQSSCFNVVIFDLTATEIEYPAEKVRLDETKKKMKTEIIDLDDHDLDQDFKDGGVSMSTKKPTNGGTTKASSKSRVKDKAMAFQSKIKNPSFICKMSRSHVNPARSVHVPESFTEKHLAKSTKEFVFEVSDGRSWDVRCNLYHYDTQRKPKLRAELVGGWKKFAWDNDLEVGDFCVFELIKKTSRTIFFNVEFFRVS